MAQWNQAPTRIQAPPLTDDATVLRAYVAKLADVVAIISKDLDFIINGNLDANNIRANSIETKNLKAGSVVADKIDVNELSAISANLGHIIAGLIESIQIFGSYIATSQSYPRAEMSSDSDLFAARGSANSNISMYAQGDGFGGRPIMFFEDYPNLTQVSQTNNSFRILSPESRIELSTPNSININGGSVTIKGGSSLDAIFQPNSVATTVPALVADFNSLLSSLRAMNILA